MALNTNKNLKLYYNIGEVAEMLQVNESLLRFWEREVDIISPKKSKGGTRKYSKEDIETIRLFYHLVREKGMTLQGARNKLKNNKDSLERNYEIIRRLEAVKAEILAIKAEFNANLEDPDDPSELI
ncbi:MAG: MerR family transcriptional regulator [Bacteroidales bacterium]